jgi:hypothetical protein
VDVLVWLAVPLAVTALGAAIIVWRSRPRQSPGPVKTAAAYARFQAALQRPRSTRTLSVVAQRDTTRKAVALRPARDAEEAASSYRPAGVGGRSR